MVIEVEHRGLLNTINFSGFLILGIKTCGVTPVCYIS